MVQTELADTTRNRYRTKQQLEMLAAARAEQERLHAADDYRVGPAAEERNLGTIRDLSRAGVMLLAGTQLGHDSVGTPGATLHDELALFVRAGLTPAQALRATTLNPARFMRRDHDLGTIDRGKLADLVLLDGNPLTDIANTRRIHAVIAGGRYLSRATLDAMLNAVAEKAAGAQP